METKSVHYLSSTGKNQIHAQYWIPDESPIAVLQIAHGIADHIMRYDDFARYLAEHRILVAGNDHLGHGENIKNGIRGFFAANDGWEKAVKDMKTLRDNLVNEYPSLPHILFGHSMGSFLARTYLIDYPDDFTHSIISGTGHQSFALSTTGYLLASGAVKMYGPERTGETLNSIAFGSYNKEFEPKRTEFDWISRDPEQVDRYIADPYCGFAATVSLYRDMMQGILYITKQSNINKMNKDIPVMFLSGSKDPVGENGKGVERAYKAFCKAGIKNIFFKLYPEGRHEMLNEINKSEVYSDINNWIRNNI